MEDLLIIDKAKYHSRLLVGTGKYRDHDETAAAIEASLASDSSDLLVITTGALPPKTTPAAQAPIK